MIHKSLCYRWGNRPKYQVNESTGCWDWLAGKQKPTGYGTTGKKGCIYAHRLSYELLRGPIPGGMTLDHLCHNRACVNPDHLEVVTLVAENIRRSPRCRLTSQDVTEIRAACDISLAKIAAKYWVSKQAIFRIKKGLMWTAQ